MTVTADNLWFGDADTLKKFQRYLVLHEMVHLYLNRKSLTFMSIPPEVYGVRESMDLVPDDQWRNPENYVYYTSSEYALCRTKRGSVLNRKRSF